MKNQNLFLGLAALAAAPLVAELVPAPLFNHNMVLQRDRKVAVWGKADAGAEVTVAFAGATVKATAGANGAWRVDLPAMPADATPRAMAISSSAGDRLVYTNAVVGEVWLCGGQSNMTFAMWPTPRIGQHAGRERNGYYDLALTNEPDVRGVRMYECWSPEPKDHDRLNWFAFTPGNGGDFSGAAWHYAIRLYRALKIPVGVIESAWGGSCIETWIPPEAYAASKSFKELATRPIVASAKELEREKQTGKKTDLHQRPRACWNAMIHPLAPYGIRGAIWYQGCTNRGKWREYYEMLETLRAGWGRAFECPEMPFFICQIAPYGYTSEEKDGGETQIREEMERWALDYAPNAGMATLSDVGEIDNIHPGDKRTVGTRLAALALNRIYGFKQLKCDAPVLDTAAKSDDGKTVMLTFKNVEDWCMNGTYKLRFELAGEDGRYVAVDSRPIARSNRVELTVPAGMTPKKVAYMRKSCVHGTLKNEAGLPLGPFRRDL
ncbi:MAG: sialate O-acetylesterase [Kiritimatiellia bacterium]